MVERTDEHSRYPIFAICEKDWEAHKSDCSGYVRAVAHDLGVPLSGLANQLVDHWNKGGGWMKLSGPLDASIKATQGYLVVAGKKEKGHGHVVVVVPGHSSHNDAMGYWGMLHHVGKKDQGLGWAWKRSELKSVSYFAIAVPSLKANQ